MLEGTELITASLPLPPKSLQANGSTNRMARAVDKKKTRLRAYLAFRELSPPIPWERAKYRVEFRVPRKMDQDNLISWLKSYLDGIQDAGVVRNDSGLSLDGISQLSGAKQTGGNFGVTITIWGAPCDTADGD